MLGQVEVRQRIEKLVEQLRTGNEREREAAQETLVRIGEAAMPFLIKALDDERFEQDPQNLALLYLTRTLARLDDTRAIEALINALRQPSVNKRLLVGMALGQAGPVVIEPMLEALEDKEAVVRGWAVGTLGQFAEPRVIKALVGCLKDEDSEVRFGAVSTLGKIGDESALVALEQTRQNDTGEYGCFGDKISTAAEQAIEQIAQRLEEV